MRILLWASLALIIYVYLGYPMIIWALSRLRPRRVKSAPISPSVSIIMAVHNGRPLLARKIEHLLTLDYSNVREIIVVSDGSDDGTAEWIRDLKHPRVHPLILSEHAGKAVALNAGMRAATGEILLFVDIRPELGPGALQCIVEHFADERVGCVAAKLSLVQDSHGAVPAAIGGLYWRYEQWIRESEARFDSPVGVSGACYAIRRSLAVDQPVGLILDDMFQPLSIIRQGYRAVIASDARVFDRLPETVDGEFHRKVRTLAGNLQLIRRAPWILTAKNRVLFQIVSHKFLRLLVPYLMVIALLCEAALCTSSYVYAALLGLQLMALAFAVVGLLGEVPFVNRVAAPCGALLALNAAAVVGLYRSLHHRGPLWKIWTSGIRVDDTGT